MHRTERDPLILLSSLTSCLSNVRCAVNQGSPVALWGPLMVLELKGQTLCCTSAGSPPSAVGRRTSWPMLLIASWRQSWTGEEHTCRLVMCHMSSSCQPYFYNDGNWWEVVTVSPALQTDSGLRQPVSQHDLVSASGVWRDAVHRKTRDHPRFGQCGHMFHILSHSESCVCDHHTWNWIYWYSRP